MSRRDPFAPVLSILARPLLVRFIWGRWLAGFIFGALKPLAKLDDVIAVILSNSPRLHLGSKGTKVIFGRVGDM